MEAYAFGMAGTHRGDKGEDKARPGCSWPWHSHDEVVHGSWCPGGAVVQARMRNASVLGPRRRDGLMVVQSKGQNRVRVERDDGMASKPEVSRRCAWVWFSGCPQGVRQKEVVCV